MRDLWVEAAGRVTLLAISHRAGHAGHTCHLCCMESKTVTSALSRPRSQIGNEVLAEIEIASE